MNRAIERAMAKPEILIMGPVVSPASGDKLPISITTRKIYSYPESLKIIAQEIGKIAKKLKADRVAGGETAGIPLATAVSLTTNIPLIYVRKEKIKFPRRSVEGIINKNDRIVLIDDTFVSGEHKENFIKNIKQMGGQVVGLIVLINVPNNSKENKRKKYLLHLREGGIRFFALCKHPELFKALGKYKCLSPEMTKIAVDCAKDFRKWQKNQKKWSWFYKIYHKQNGKFI